MDTKPWWASKTHWFNTITGLLPLLVVILKPFGIDLPLSDLTPDQIMALATSWVGLLTLGNYWLRAITKKPIGKPGENPRGDRLLHPFTAVAALLLTGLLISGCSAVDRAETPVQKAFALYGTYVTAQEAAAELVEMSDMPGSVVGALAMADSLAWPLASAMRQAAQETAAAQAEISAIRETGATPPQQLVESAAVALDHLTRLMRKAEPQISEFIRALGQARAFVAT